METINERIKALRKALGMNQEELGKILGVSKSAVCDIEAGRRRVTDAHIVLLTHMGGMKAREEWLRNGGGEMFSDMDSALAELQQNNDTFLNDLIEVYLSMDGESRRALQEFVRLVSIRYAHAGDTATGEA